jgi:hypothetical protein
MNPVGADILADRETVHPVQVLQVCSAKLPLADTLGFVRFIRSS